MTADEHEPDEPTLLERAASLASRVLAALLAAWRMIRRAAMGLLAVAIMLALAGLWGYAYGRHSVAPKPGEEARLDSANKRLQATADSARKVAEWEHAQRAILEQRAAALPRVEIREPGVLVIKPVGDGSALGPAIEPRIVTVPVAVTATLASERAISNSLRTELAAVRVEAEAERARADSLSRAVVLARAQRRGFLSDRVVLTVGYGVTSAGGQVRPGWQVGVGVALWRWP